MKNMGSHFHLGKPFSSGLADHSTVDRAIGKLKRLGLIEGTERRLSYTKNETTLYAITWQPFFTAFRRVEAWKSERRHVTRDVTEGVVPENDNRWSSKMSGVVPENEEHISLSYLSKDDLTRSPYGDPLRDIHESLFGKTQPTSERMESQQASKKEAVRLMDALSFMEAKIKGPR